MRPRMYILGICLLAGALMAGCDRHTQSPSTRPASAQAARPIVAASVFPIAELVRAVAADRWTVVTLLPPGRNPHGYALRPAEAESLIRAKLLFAAGIGLDDWASRAARGINPRCRVVVLSETLQPVAASRPLTGDRPFDAADGPAHEEHDEAGHAGLDPHLWLDPLLAAGIAETAARELARADPAGQGTYQKHLAVVKQQLTALDREYRVGLEGCRTRTLVVFHPGYGFLARRYHLEQVAVTGGAGANPAHIEQVIDRIRRERIGAIYREPQFDSKWVNFLQQQTGVRVLVLDPQGHAAKAGYDSYFAMMRTNLAALKEGLDCGP